MSNKWMTLFLRMTLLMIMYFFFLQFISNVIIIVIITAIFFFYAARLFRVKTEDNVKLEMMCDAPGYIRLIQARRNDEGLNNLYLAYGYVYNGEYEKAETLIVNYDYLELDIDSVTIWFDVKFKLALYNKDKKTYTELIQKLSEVTLEIDANDLQIAKVLVNVLDENYVDLKEGLFKIIPLQKKRMRLIELEYYLGIAHKYTESIEDAIAVLEFAVKKGNKLIYVEYCKNLLNELKN